MPATDQPRRARNSRIALVLAIVLLLVAAHQLGILEQFREPAQVKRTLLGLGGWGYLAFIVSYTLLQPFGVPGTVFIVAAPLIWPWPVAFVLSMIGTMCASVVGFSFARFVARDFIAARIPERFRRYDDALERRAFATVFLLRLIFWMPPLLHAFFGVSKVRFRTHFWGSFFGYVLPLLAVSYFGEKLFAMFSDASPATWLGALAVVLVLIAGTWFYRRAAAKAAAQK